MDGITIQQSFERDSCRWNGSWKNHSNNQPDYVSDRTQTSNGTLLDYCTTIVSFYYYVYQHVEPDIAFITRTLPNWVLEFEKWAPAISTIVYKGNPQSRKPLQASIRHGGFQVLLTTFDYIIKDRPVLCKVKWTYMIIDEGHRMKNANSKLTTVLRQYYTTRYRLILTGTPLQVNQHLWQQMTKLTVSITLLEQLAWTVGSLELYSPQDL